MPKFAVLFCAISLFFGTLVVASPIPADAAVEAPSQAYIDRLRSEGYTEVSLNHKSQRRAAQDSTKLLDKYTQDQESNSPLSFPPTKDVHDCPAFTAILHVLKILHLSHPRPPHIQSPLYLHQPFTPPTESHVPILTLPNSKK